MDSKLISIDITADIFKIYGEYMDKAITVVRIIHDDDIVALEILKIEPTVNNLIKQTITRTDLGFIADEPDEPMFPIENSIEENVKRFLTLTPYTLINTTDLFSEEAADRINKKFNVFGVDN